MQVAQQDTPQESQQTGQLQNTMFKDLSHVTESGGEGGMVVSSDPAARAHPEADHRAPSVSETGSTGASGRPRLSVP